MASSINDEQWNVVCEDEIFKRTSFGCDVYQDRYIVIAGGRRKFVRFPSTIMYDVATKSCITLPDLPHACGYHGVVLNGYFYVVTSELSDLVLHRICLSRRMKWEFVVERKGYYCIAGMISDGNHIFLMDYNEGMISFDPTNNELIPVNNNTDPIRRWHLSTALVGSKIYIIGGRPMDRSEIKNLTVFDIETKSWSQSSSLPALYDFATIVIDKWIVVTGREDDGSRRRGDNGSHILSFVYDTRTQVWTQVSATSATETFQRCVKVRSQIFSLGGLRLFDSEWKHCPMSAIHIKHVIPHWTWHILKPFILLRHLIHDKRATPVKTTNKRNYAGSDMQVDVGTDANKNAVVQRVFTEDMPLDMFRYILLFLK